MAQIPSENDPPGWQVEMRSGSVALRPGVLAELGSLVVQRFEGRRAFLISDEGVVAAGHAEAARRSLADAGVAVEVYGRAEENPTESCAERAAAAARSFQPELLVAVGGGSVMDTTKAVNFLLAGGGRMRDYHGFGQGRGDMLPSVGVPCTAGTGSEAQSFALISRDDDHVKMACGDVGVRFGLVALDPDVLRTMPREVAAVTGMDAVSHALEAAVTRTRNPISDAYARKSWALLERSFEGLLGPARAAEDGARVREEMLAGAFLAGAAIESSMLGLAHALANPVTASFDLTHGAAVGVFLPSVIRWNADCCEETYRQVALVSGTDASRGAAEGLARRVEEIRAAAGLPASLAGLGISEADLASLAVAASEQWTGQHNPRRATAADLESLYRGVLFEAAA